MAKYHYSQNIGEARRCYAQEGNCPLAALNEHFEDYDVAAAYAERKNTENNGGSFGSATHKSTVSLRMDATRDTHTRGEVARLDLLEIADEDFDKMSLDQKKKHQQLVFDTAKRLKQPLTRNLSQQHERFVAEVADAELAAGRTTDNLHRRTDDKGRPVQGRGRRTYTKERQKQQQEVLNYFLDKYKDVPAQRKALVSGGMGGAGKGYTLRELKGVDPDDPTQFAVANPDDFKEVMAERGMLPEVEGTTPMDMNTLVHEEASMLSKELQAQLIDEGKNVVFDRTVAKTKNIKKELDAAREKGYKIEGVFVDVSPETSDARAQSRYLSKLNTYTSSGGENGNGGRFLPKFVNAAEPESHHKSVNAENFQKLSEEGYFTAGVAYYDNDVDGGKPKVIPERDFFERGNKKS